MSNSKYILLKWVTHGISPYLMSFSTSDLYTLYVYRREHLHSTRKRQESYQMLSFYQSSLWLEYRWWEIIEQASALTRSSAHRWVYRACPWHCSQDQATDTIAHACLLPIEKYCVGTLPGYRYIQVPKRIRLVTVTIACHNRFNG